MQVFFAVMALIGLGFAPTLVQSAVVEVVSPPVVPEPRDELPPPVKPEPRQSTGCNFEYTFPSIGAYAAIRSPNYPSDYSANLNCQYVIKSPVGSQITMTCDEFNVEYDASCAYDSFFYSVTGDVGFRDASRVCGKGTLSGIISKLNSLTIGFKTDTTNPISTSSYRFNCLLQSVASVPIASATNVAPATTKPPAVASTSAPATTKAPVVTSTSAPATTKAPATTVKPATASACSCGERNEVPRIVGGTEAGVNEFPWRCNLYAPSMGVFCGATVISNSWVLTAAHCTNAIPAGTTYYVDCGDHDISSATESNNVVVKVIKAYQHASYNSNTQDNDVSLLQLEKPLNFTREVQPICLPYHMVGKNLTGTTAVASGWGTTSSGGSQPNTLLKVDLPVLTTTECQRYYGTSVTNNMICTYNPGKDTCQGDSGGSIDYKDPNTGRYSNIGVVSWGVGCAGTNQPGVYANVMNYLKWIETTTAATFCKP